MSDMTGDAYQLRSRLNVSMVGLARAVAQPGLTLVQNRGRKERHHDDTANCCSCGRDLRRLDGIARVPRHHAGAGGVLQGGQDKGLQVRLRARVPPMHESAREHHLRVIAQPLRIPLPLSFTASGKAALNSTKVRKSAECVQVDLNETRASPTSPPSA
jgi:hypothetical protein